MRNQFKLDTFITKQRNQYALDLADNKKYWSLSALTLTHLGIINQIFSKYAKGKVLDTGAGTLNAKSLILKQCTEYVSLDIEKRNKDIDLIGDIQSMVDVPNESCDTVYASQVLEHIPLPLNALSEIHRVLRPGGYAIISVPHLSGLHEEPYDFYRYTPYGIRFLIEKTGFTVVVEYRIGGLFSFLSHPFSMVIVSSFWPISGLKWLVWLINKIIIVHPAIWLDKIFRLERKFPVNLIIVGEKSIQ